MFKRIVENTYLLKMKHARTFFSQVNSKSPTMPFSIRQIEDPITAKVGVKECIDHDLLTTYPVLVEKDGETVAQFKATVCILQKGTTILAGNLPLAESSFSTENKVTDQAILDILAVSLDKKTQKKKNKGAKKEEKTEKAAEK